MDLVTNKDLLNIKRDYKINVQEGVKHREDAVSIDMWVEECKSGDNNPVLFYKRQGESHEHLHDNDFCLIFMNEYQKSMFCTFGKNIVAIDSTHGLNNYDFELTTVMVLDDYGEGFPVCSMFTNRKDTYINQVFFEKIRDAIGVIEAKVFMSDITEVFFNAWFSVMGKVEHKLFCSWHIDRAWQKNLSKIQNSSARQWVYKTLKTLQENMDIDSFQLNLKTFIEHLEEDPNTQSFAKYFTSTYAHNFQQWAYCFRKGCGINTNMVLESMHKTVKYFYLDGKTVKRLDKGLHAVLNYIRDKMVSVVHSFLFFFLVYLLNNQRFFFYFFTFLTRFVILQRVKQDAKRMYNTQFVKMYFFLIFGLLVLFLFLNFDIFLITSKVLAMIFFCFYIYFV